MHRSIVRIVAVSWIMYWCLPSRAEWQAEYLTGDWGGTRTRLAEHGIDMQFVYTGEVFGRARGSASSEYLGNVDFTVELDSEKLGWWKGGSFFFYGQNNHGRGISPTTGAFHTHSHLEPDAPFSQVSEFWYRHEFRGGKLAFKIGKMDANVDFAATDTGGYFIQSAAGTFPTLIMPTFPNPRFGFGAFAAPVEFVTLQAGVFDDGGRREALPAGTSSPFDPGNATVTYAELQLHTDRLSGWLPGTVRLGGWYDTTGFQELPWFPEPEPGAADPPELKIHGNNYGAYLTLDQTLLRESANLDEAQGLSFFFQAGRAPDNRNEVGLFLGGGLAYQGLLPARDEDIFGVYVAHSDFSSRLRESQGLTWETAIEVTYRVQVTPFLTLQPDFQYVVRPGGDRQAEDAAILGLRGEVVF